MEKCSPAKVYRKEINKQRQSVSKILKDYRNENSETMRTVCTDSNRTDTGVINTLHCSMCNVAFMGKAGLDSHMTTHNKLYYCNLCVLYFETGEEREQHIKVHTEVKRNVCNVCRCSVLGSVEDLVNHMTEHVDTDKLLNCSVCSVEFSHNSHLKAHMVTHADENQYICRECTIIFNQKFHFTHHMSLHVEQTCQNHNMTADKSFTSCEKAAGDLKISTKLGVSSHVFSSTSNENSLSTSQSVDTLFDSCTLAKTSNQQHGNCNSSDDTAESYPDFNFEDSENCCNHKDEDIPVISKEENLEKSEGMLSVSRQPTTFSTAIGNAVVRVVADCHDSCHRIADCHGKLRGLSRRKIGNSSLDKGINKKRFKDRVKRSLPPHQNNSKKPVLPEKQICTICSRAFSSLKELKAHNRTHNGNKDCKVSLELHDCQKELRENSEILQSSKKCFKCDVCSKLFKRESSFLKHARLHNAENLLYCDLCPHTSTDCGGMRKHMRTHQTNTPYLCHICQKQFKWKHSLNLHIQVHSGVRKYSCETCKKTFYHKGSLTIHMRTHTGEKPFLCNFCSKLFSQKGQLDVHIMRVHLGEKPFQCSICDKCFAQKIDMKSHIRSHTGEKPFQCTFCSKTFKHKFRMVTHMRTHTGEKPYTCTHCPKTFTKREKLVRHLRVHTGEKPFVCKVCSRSFAQRETLNNHMRTHDGLKPFSCKICSKLFSLRGSLRSHMRVHKELDEVDSGKSTKKEAAQLGNSVVLINPGGVELTPLVNSNQITQFSSLSSNQCLDKRNYLIHPVPELYGHPSVALTGSDQKQPHNSNIYICRSTDALSMNAHPGSYNIDESISRL